MRLKVGSCFVVGAVMLTSWSGCGDDSGLEPHAIEAPPDTRPVTPGSGTPGGGAPGSGAKLDAGSTPAAGGDMDGGLRDAGGGDPGPEPGKDAGSVDASAPGSLVPTIDASTGTDGGATDLLAKGQLDLLFVIDNSGSMASEQVKLANELPRLLRILTSGDRCAGSDPSSCKLDDGTTPKRRFAPVQDLHLGVISTNLGGIDEPTGTQPAILACRGLGDDAKLQNSRSVAVDGVVAGRREFEAYEMGEVVLSPLPECAGPSLPLYQQYLAGQTNVDQAASDFRCVSRLGVRGCPFEQPLEAMWKALAPSTGRGPGFAFLSGSQAQGDLYNKGFMRPNAVLAVLHVSDEEDCSIRESGKVLFAQGPDAQTEYGPINLRCGLHVDEEELVHPVQRYVDGLRSLKPGHPERVVFSAIVGLPLDAGDKTYDELLALPALQFAENPLKPGFPATSCNTTSASRVDEAYPPRRFLELARGLGEQAMVSSICADSYGPAIDRLVSKIAASL